MFRGKVGTKAAERWDGKPLKEGLDLNGWEMCFVQCDPDPHVFGLLDPDPLVRRTDPDLSLFSKMK
jgi:hypothetical protein